MKIVEMKQVRKGTRVMLSNGFEADVLDNLTNRQTRMCQVYGYSTEMGSVYTADIQSALVDGQWCAVRHSDKTLKLQEARKQWGF